MNNIKVRAKLTIVMIVSVLALAICTYLSIVSMNQLQTKALDVIEEDARSSYDEEIRQQVENVISLCQNIYDKYQAGEFTEQEAKKLAADEIRALRYGDNGYFWVDQYDGTNVVSGKCYRGDEPYGDKRRRWLSDGERDYPCR